MLISLLVTLNLAASSVWALCQPASTASFLHAPIPAAGLKATPIFGNLSTPRDILFDALGTLLVVERGVGVSAFVQRHDSACIGWDRSLVVNNSALTNGIELEGPELYVSSMTQVLRYTYDAKTRTVSGTPILIVDGLPSDGELPARTLLLASPTLSSPRSLFVSDGPLDNIDPTASDPANGRSQIRRFTLPPLGSPSFPAAYIWTGPHAQLIAYGIRNPAGLSLGPEPGSTTLWAVENGASLNAIVGDSLSTDTPADELEKIDLKKPAKSYGFPYCHTGFAPLPAPYDVVNPGDQFSINSTTAFNNIYCRNPSNNIPPTLLFQPHSVPLDIKFYKSHLPSSQGLPVSWTGDAFVSFHGSFDRVPPTGYAVVRIPWKSNGSGPVASPTTRVGYEILVQAANLTSCPASCVRPVGLAFEPKTGRLFVSSDSSGELFYLSKA